MLPAARDVLTWERRALKDTIHPSALHTFSAPLRPIGSSFWPPDDFQPGPGDALCPLQNSSNVGCRTLEEEVEEPYSPSAPSPPHAPHNDAGPTLQGHKLLSGKEFPFKLYSMLEDGAVKRYATWSKIGNRDALFIPDVEAFIANVLPKHFKEMKKGADKALYTHVEDKFQRGHPELLRYVRRGANGQTSARPKQKRHSIPIAPAATSTSPESGSQNDSSSHKDQSQCNTEGLELKILKLESDLESSEERRSAIEVRLQAATTRLQEAEERIMRMENQMAELSKILEQRSTGDSTLDSVGDSRSSQPENNFDILINALNVPTAADGGVLTHHVGTLQSLSFESHMVMETVYHPLDPQFGLDFLSF
ncbi:hypothetical protein FRC01_003386 [Tulasnella sp. 417]|nr:hypothetical protein FRC01_003386 [Tulasnella sp. 417]